MIKTYEMYHLVMGPDLNHHGTLFAGQCTKWFIESGFIAAANAASPESTVCINLHGMVFKKPVLPGTMIRFESKVILAGRSRLMVYVRAINSKIEELVVDGFLTFVNVDPQGRSLPHGITIAATSEEDIALQERAKTLSA